MHQIWTRFLFCMAMLLPLASGVAVAADGEVCEWFGNSKCFGVDWKTITPQRARYFPPTLKDSEERTPLHWAAHYNDNVVVIEALLQAKADVNARDKFKNTPLHDAAWYSSNPQVIKILLDAGADLHAQDKYGQTPLHDAAANNTPSIVQVLIAAGADLHARSHDGGTPLHWAAVHNRNADVMKTLLDAGASPHTKNEDGQTPLVLMENQPALQGTETHHLLRSVLGY